MGLPTSDFNARNPDALALIALFLGAVAVGASPVFVRISELGPFATAFYRPFLALPALWLWMRLGGRQGPVRGPRTLRDVLLLMGAGAFFSGDLAFWHLSILNTTIANATLFANMAPLFVTLAIWAIWGQRPTRTFVGGMALALAGSACLGFGSFRLAPDNLLGDGYGIVTALFLSAYLIAVSRLTATFTVAAIMTWGSLGTAVVLLPVALLAGENMVATSLNGWLILLALALFSHAAGQGLIAYALRHLPAAFSSVGLLAEPVAAAALAAVLLSELPGLWQMGGGIIILTGIAIARRGSR